MSEELSHTEDMTIEDFLSGATAYEIADNALKRVLVKRKIAFGTMVSELTERQLDLATADLSPREAWQMLLDLSAKAKEKK